jgi:type I restriction enzyme R subunit
MGMGEADTRAKLIDPALHGCGWTEELIFREVTAGAIEISNDGKPRKRRGGRDILYPSCQAQSSFITIPTG